MPTKCMLPMLAAQLAGTGAPADSPPGSLVRENIRKSSVILKGRIESTEAPRAGVTVAHFRVSRSFRGAFKPGDQVAFASFKEQDRYPEKFLQGEPVVFLTARRLRSAFPKWETASDLSEFLVTPESELSGGTGQREGDSADRRGN